MVLSNTKLKRKKREEAASAVVLNPPPDSNATSSLANDVKGDSPVVLSVKKVKRAKSKASNGDVQDGETASGPGSEGALNSNLELSVEGNVLHGDPVQQAKKKTKKPKNDTVVRLAHDSDVGEILPSAADTGSPEENAVGGQEEAPKKIRKKARWEVDDSGKRVRPMKDGGEREELSTDAKAFTPSVEGAGEDDAVVKGEGDAAVAAHGDVNNGERIHQGDEPWLQSKRSKKKKKLTDRWGKKLSDAEAVGDDNPASLEEPTVVSSVEEKVDPKKVMVGGMPYYITEDDIHEYFQECGTISELDCMTFPDTGKFKGIAFITFREEQMAVMRSHAVKKTRTDAYYDGTIFNDSTEEAAKRALAIDGADMGGRFLKIEICKIRPREPAKKDTYKEPPKKYEGCLSAYIGNLSWDVTEKELRKFFQGCKIDSIRFAVNKETEEFRGFGHVDFVDDESLETAMKLDQTPLLGRPLKIAYSVPQKVKPAEGRVDQSGTKKKGCFTCGEEGHMSYNCPKKL